jgi:hypothetical protein
LGPALPVILNLVPEFLAVLTARDRETAYHEYLRRHEAVLGPYWHNYVFDLDLAPAREVIAQALAADRRDLSRLLETTDLERAANEALDAAAGVLELDVPVQVYLTVGVGGANAGELVVHGQGIVIVCVEHFTGVANPQTHGLGLPAALLGPWIAHEVAHLVRYLSPASRADLRRLVADAGGTYDCWDLASRATLRELLVNEGVAVHAARLAAPGHADEVYLGFSRRHFRRLREMEAFLMRVVSLDLDSVGLGLRLRWLTGGLTPAARMVQGRVLPERAGYYLGMRMTEALVAGVGPAAAARAAAAECAAADALFPSTRAVNA